MFTRDLTNKILLDPNLASQCTSLKIITGYTDVECIYRHLIGLSDLGKTNSFSVEMILGMTGNNGLSKKKHKNISNLITNINDNKEMPDFICRYKKNGLDIHSKVYIWFKNDIPVCAFCGSANYSINAFYKRRECMTNCDPQEAKRYFESLIPDTILSTDSFVNETIPFARGNVQESEIDNYNLENLSWKMFENKKPLDICEISLLKADGSGTGYGSGLNWGIRKNGTQRDPNQAYIPYNVGNRKEGFFPLKNNDSAKNNPIFKVVPKDFPPFFMRIAQQGNKGIHTAESNALLGKFFRKKLHLSSGTFITKEMLEEYGRTSVVFKKYENDIYVLDF